MSGGIELRYLSGEYGLYNKNMISCLLDIIYELVKDATRTRMLVLNDLYEVPETCIIA